MATRLKCRPKERAVVIVAHPDDETIWMGGFILKHPELDWTIMALCRASDLDRAPKFKRVCERYGATAIIEDMDDEGHLDYDQTVAEAGRLAGKYLSRLPIDYLFTHGANGEYGHEAHVAVNQAIKGLAAAGQLQAQHIFCFNYAKQSRKLHAQLRPKADSDFILNLNKQQFAEKKSIMTGIYGFAPDGIDTNYCTNPEAFKKLK
jgi:LmbE family N-acetylglucosaminyl deacetylase